MRPPTGQTDARITPFPRPADRARRCLFAAGRHAPLGRPDDAALAVAEGAGPARPGRVARLVQPHLPAHRSRPDRRPSAAGPSPSSAPSWDFSVDYEVHHRRMAAAAGRIGSARQCGRHRLEQSLAVRPGRRDRSRDTPSGRPRVRRDLGRRRRPHDRPGSLHELPRLDSTTIRRGVSESTRRPSGSGSSRRLARSAGGATEAEEIFDAAADRGAEGASPDRRGLR